MSIGLVLSWPALRNAENKGVVMTKTQRFPLFLVLLLTLTWQVAQALLPGVDAQGMLTLY